MLLSEQFSSAIQLLSNRCLFQSTKWLAEALNGLDGQEIEDGFGVLHADNLSYKEILAKSYFDCHEYDRCSNLLKDQTSLYAVFLRLYSSYICGEKKKEEEHEGILSPKDGISSNPNLPMIVGELDEYCQSHDPDAFLNYLYGVVLVQQKNETEAINRLISSLTSFPYNWSAWQELLSCIPTVDKLTSLISLLPNHIMSQIFLVYAQQELFQHDQSLHQDLDSLLHTFPSFRFLDIQKAMLLYHGLDYVESEKTFETVLKQDPYRLDDMDTYSNILYVMERRAELAHLAQMASATDKFRPETCCIIANYYSLKSEHEKAITYYQRALVLNRNCLSAWTLMGHEFVELKNTHAAIESYRRAIDANKKDYRAWYGLGQAYEVLDMHYYSLYYYQRATSLKPFDARMWQALGNCYDKLDRIDNSIKAFKRALRVSDMDPLILVRIALLYEKANQLPDAASFMKLCLAEEANEGPTDETCQARLWLARYEMKRGNWLPANKYARGFTRGSAGEIEEARAIVRDTVSRLGAAGGTDIRD